MRRAALALIAVLLSLACAPTAMAQGAARLSDMPLVELPATGGGGDTLVVFYSGDGGWATLDQNVSAALAAGGAPVVGVNSLRYFAGGHTADQAAADLTAIIDAYTARWGRRRVILAGYSFGADALPAIVPRLSPAARARLRGLALVAADADGELKFQPGDWLGRSAKDAFQLAPLIGGLRGLPMVCIQGAADKDAACDSFPPAAIRTVRLPGDHHFNNAYGDIARAVLQVAP